MMWTAKTGCVALLVCVALVSCGCGGKAGPAQTPPAADNPAVMDIRLQERLDEFRSKFLGSAPPEVVTIFKEGIEELRQSGIAEKAVNVGDQAPDFELPNATGEKVVLSQLLQRGPVVLAWYRGGWCPYCNIELHALQEALPRIRKLGATLVAVSPQTADNSLTTKQTKDLKFEILSDRGSEVGRAYGLVYTVSDDVRVEMEKMMSLDLEKVNGDDRNELPIPATYVIDQTGVVRFAYVDPDYRNRAAPNDVFNALREIKNEQ